MFKTGTIEKYLEHMKKLHGDTEQVQRFSIQQISLVQEGVRDVRLGDDAVILLDGIVQ